MIATWVVVLVIALATMATIGNRNWYLPAWLAWLPEIHIDGASARVAPEPHGRDADGLVPEPTIAD